MNTRHFMNQQVLLALILSTPSLGLAGDPCRIAVSGDVGPEGMAKLIAKGYLLANDSRTQIVFNDSLIFTRQYIAKDNWVWIDGPTWENRPTYGTAEHRRLVATVTKDGKTVVMKNRTYVDYNDGSLKDESKKLAKALPSAAKLQKMFGECE